MDLARNMLQNYRELGLVGGQVKGDSRMKLKEITSNELPEIGRPVAECVNSGEWTLYRSAAPNGESSDNFFLKMGVEVYVLDSRGRILKVLSRDSSPAMDEVFYFSDLPKPQSLSNGNLRLILH